MTTLNSEPVASLLARLFTEADTSRVDIPAAFTGMSDDRAHAMLGSRTEYIDLYTRMKDLPLPVSREAGSLLYMLARFGNARSIVEFGTSFGISALHLAAAIRDNGGGRVITTEFEPSKIARARENLEAGGRIDLVEIREGDALETLGRDLPKTIDLVPARRRQGPLQRHSRPAGEPASARHAAPLRQCRYVPGLSGPGPRGRRRISLDPVRR